MTRKIREAWGMIETLLRDNPGMRGADLAPLIRTVLDVTQPMLDDILGQMVAEYFLVVDRSVSDKPRYYLSSDHMIHRVVPADEYISARSRQHARSPIAWCVNQLQEAV